MKAYYGNHIGVVVNNNDPEYRGRVQVFVPHIMPTLYEGWNKQEGDTQQDIQFTCVGDNIEGGLTSDILQRLVQILPWAEAASPIIGASAPGGVISDVFSAVQSAYGAVAGAVAGVAGAIMDQGPTSEPVQVEGGDVQGLINKAKAIPGIGIDYNPDPKSAVNSLGGQWGMCARGTTGLDKAAGLIDNNGGSAGFNAAKDLAAGGSLFQRQTSGSKGEFKNPYTQGTGAKYFQPAFTIGTNQTSYNSNTGKTNLIGAQVGDSVFSAGGGGNGHAQKLVGIDKNGDQVWVSDNPQQDGFLTRSKKGAYTNHTIYRLNEAGLAKYSAAIGGKINGQEPSSTTGAEGGQATSAFPAGPSPQVTSDGSFADQTAVPPQDPAIAAGGEGVQGTTGGKQTIDTSNMSPAFKAQYDRVYQNLEGSKFINTVPKDGQTYGIVTGSREEWAHFFTRNASVESSFNPNTAADINGTRKGTLTSFGLYQMGQTQFKRHGGGNIYDPNDNTKSYLNYAEELYFGNTYRSGGQNVIGGKAGNQWIGLAAGYGPIRRISQGNPNSNEKQLLAENISSSERQSGNYTGTVTSTTASSPTSTNIINNTDRHGPTVVKNTNDMPKGLFAYPNVGSMVWVFFREGNPLYPVYFAASYGADEWKAAFRGSSENGLGTNQGTSGTQINNSAQINPNAAGGLEFTHIRDTADPTGARDKTSIMIYGDDGSNMLFSKGYHQIYTRHSRRDQIDGDAFRIVGGYEEKWITGDSNTNVRGNLFVKVGEISQESLAAAQALADKSAEYNAKLAQTSDSAAAGETPKTPEEKQAALEEQKAEAPPVEEQKPLVTEFEKREKQTDYNKAKQAYESSKELDQTDPQNKQFTNRLKQIVDTKAEAYKGIIVP